MHAALENAALRRLVDFWTEIRALSGIDGLLTWDQETMMPPGGEEARALQLAAIAGIRQERLASDELFAAIEQCPTDDAVSSAIVREARRAVERARAVSPALARALAAARSRGVASWQRARRANRFALFRDDLARLLDLKQEEAAALRPSAPYDALLDEYEPDATAETLALLFEPIESSLAALVAQVDASARVVDESALRGDFPIDRQLALARKVAESIGFDFGRGRLDRSAHPFCMGVAPGDVRLTWRADREDFRPGLFGILHEVGHGLYEQGLPEAWRGTPLAEPCSLGIHESQSRFWENHVGRSLEFWRFLLPLCRAELPGFAVRRAEDVWPALHVVRRSLVRVDADETTYDLHIVARFRLERALFAGSLGVDELPEAWAAEMRRLLGLEPPDDNHGVLQDIHWATGLFGYFPTYTVGNLVAAQLRETVEHDLPRLSDEIADGEFSGLLAWLRDKIHRHGAFRPGPELVLEATGEPLSASAFLRHVTKSCNALYS